MSYSSDEFDEQIRQPLYEIRETLNESYKHLDNAELDQIFEKVDETIDLADNHRSDLLDQEDEGEEAFDE